MDNNMDNNNNNNHIIIIICRKFSNFLIENVSIPTIKGVFYTLGAITVLSLTKFTIKTYEGKNNN